MALRLSANADAGDFSLGFAAETPHHKNGPSEAARSVRLRAGYRPDDRTINAASSNSEAEDRMRRPHRLLHPGHGR
jgi:hypothetical protein